MEHYHKEVTGWCDFEEIYQDAVKSFNDGLFIEIGSANGQSTAFLAVEILNSGKPIRAITCDIFVNDGQEDYVKSHIGKFPFMEVRRCTGTELLESIKDESPVFIFLDGGHDYKTVMAELKLGWDILKKGGILAGHDYTNDGSPDVRKAVNNFCKNKKITPKIIGSSFVLVK